MAGKTVLVACHQPNFLPWLGFFAKVARADAFVLLDDVQFTQGHNKHNWTTRVRVGSLHGPLWLSMPVRRSGEGLQSILDLQTPVDDRRWLPKMLKTMKESYLRAPFFAEVFPPVEAVLLNHVGSVCETNVSLITLIVGMLRLPAKIVRSSTRPVPGNSTERLVNLTLAEGGGIYLSGDGASDYQLDDAFRAAGIETRKLGFRHPEYQQRRGIDFIPGLSVFDALCHIGVEKTREILFRT